MSAQTVSAESLSTMIMGVEHFGQRKQVGWVGEEVSELRGVRSGLVRQQSLTERQESGAPPIGQEPERADADKAAGQDVEQEAAQELLRTERHHSFLISVGIILPAESNLVVLESHEAVVGDGHAMGVAGEIAQHMLGTAEGWLGIDTPQRYDDVDMSGDTSSTSMNINNCLIAQLLFLQ